MAERLLKIDFYYISLTLINNKEIKKLEKICQIKYFEYFYYYNRNYCYDYYYHYYLLLWVLLLKLKLLFIRIKIIIRIKLIILSGIINTRIIIRIIIIVDHLCTCALICRIV